MLISRFFFSPSKDVLFQHVRFNEDASLLHIKKAYTREKELKPARHGKARRSKTLKSVAKSPQQLELMGELREGISVTSDTPSDHSHVVVTAVSCVAITVLEISADS